MGLELPVLNRTLTPQSASNGIFSRSLSLTGTPIEALWDPGLSRAMIEAGYAIHEEQSLETLLLDLS